MMCGDPPGIRRLTQLSLLLASTLIGAGCSNLDFGQSPMQKLLHPVHSEKELTKAEAAPKEEERTARLQKALENWKRTSKADMTYHIGGDDIVEVAIPSLQVPDRTSIMKRALDKDGNISLPLIGKVEAIHHTTHELEVTIADAYKDKYLKDPEVTVTVAEYKSAGVWVTGAVGKPDLHYLKRDNITLLEVLSEVGGITKDAGKSLFVTRGSTSHALAQQPTPGDAASTNAPDTTPVPTNTTSTNSNFNTDSDRVEIDLAQLFDSGNPAWNIPIKSGDVVAVPPMKNNFVYVLGYVRGPGTYTITAEAPMTAWHALAKAGGLSPEGSAEKCFIVREYDNGTKHKAIALDLSKIIYGDAPDVPMQAGDTLVIGAGPFGKLMELFHVGGSATMSYAPVP